MPCALTTFALTPFENSWQSVQFLGGPGISRNFLEFSKVCFRAAFCAFPWGNAENGPETFRKLPGKFPGKFREFPGPPGNLTNWKNWRWRCVFFLFRCRGGLFRASPKLSGFVWFCLAFWFPAFSISAPAGRKTPKRETKKPEQNQTLPEHSLKNL